MAATRAVSAEILDVLARSTIADNRLVLTQQLDRDAYLAVDKIIKAVGGKWSRSAKAHVFPGDAAAALEPVLLTGTVTDIRKQYDAFYTPLAVAEQVIDYVDKPPYGYAGSNDGFRTSLAGCMVLEPSAGDGALARAIAARGARVDAYELRDITWPDLTPAGSATIDGQPAAYAACGELRLFTGVDFLNVIPSREYDRVVMNPPFSNQQDMIHVRHAANFVVPGGRLVAVMSPAFMFRTTRVAVEFREWLDDQDRHITHLPDGAFKVSGTGVRTVILTVDL